MISDSYYTKKAVLQSFLTDSDSNIPAGRRALQELPQLQQAASSAQAMCVCENWAKRQSNTASGTANVFGLASELYKQRSSACRGAAERVLQALNEPERVGVTRNQRLAAALMLDSMGELRQARAILGCEQYADATVQCENGDTLWDAYAYEQERLSTQLDWWPWLCGRKPAAMPTKITFTDKFLGPVSLSLEEEAVNF